MAAVHASQPAVKVLLVTKGERAKSGATVMAIGALAGVGPWRSPKDSLESHLRDTIRGGCFLNEQNLTRIMVEEAPRRIMELEQGGAYFERAGKGNCYSLRTEGGHGHARGIYTESRIGAEILRTLYGEMTRLRVGVHDHLMAVELIRGKGGIGALGLDLAKGDWVLIESKAVVLATGGPGQLYLYNTHDLLNTGDGVALALKAGATLQDMEFTQFYPWGLKAQGSRGGLLAGVSYFSRLYNRDQERFMEKYDSDRLEMSTRDVVARAMVQEIREGRGTEKGGVNCDMTHQAPSVVRDTLPALHHFLLKCGIDPERDIFPVIPTFHYHIGGVKVDEDWQTTCPGLFAAGEVAGGVHGANRLSQNSLSDIIVSGARAGEKAADYARKISKFSCSRARAKEAVERYEGLFAPRRKSSLSRGSIKKKIQRTMWEKVGVVRNKKDLEQAVKLLQRIQREEIPRMTLGGSHRIYNRELMEFMEARHLAEIGECVALSALQREESRGAHFREDFPGTDNAGMLKHITLSQEGKKILLGAYPVDLSVEGPERPE